VLAEDVGEQLEAESSVEAVPQVVEVEVAVELVAVAHLELDP
jgi:hypothetical protein